MTQNDRLSKIKGEVQALCEDVGLVYSDTLRPGKATVIRDPGNCLQIIIPRQVNEDGVATDYRSPFGIFNATDEEFSQRIELARNAVYIAQHPEEH
jgi:hypothetical protein